MALEESATGQLTCPRTASSSAIIPAHGSARLRQQGLIHKPSGRDAHPSSGNLDLKARNAWSIVSRRAFRSGRNCSSIGSELYDIDRL